MRVAWRTVAWRVVDWQTVVRRTSSSAVSAQCPAPDRVQNGALSDIGARNGSAPCTEDASCHAEAFTSLGDTSVALAPVEMDTWRWVNAAMAASHLDRAQSEAVVAATARIASFRLSAWERSGVVAQARIAHDLYLRAEHARDACRRQVAALSAGETEARARMAHIAAEMTAAADALRETAAAVRTDTAVALGGLRLEGREQMQRAETVLGRLRGDLGAAAASLRSGAEDCKARVTSLFAGLLGAALVLVAVDRTLVSRL